MSFTVSFADDHLESWRCVFCGASDLDHVGLLVRGRDQPLCAPAARSLRSQICRALTWRNPNRSPAAKQGYRLVDHGFGSCRACVDDQMKTGHRGNHVDRVLRQLTMIRKCERAALSSSARHVSQLRENHRSRWEE